MNKAFINKICNKFGFEINGISYMQQLRKTAVVPDALQIQQELLGDRARLIFDVGANNGNVTLRYKEFFPKATIHAFEPFPEMYRELVRVTQGNANIHTSDKAIAENSGKQTFFVNAGIDTNSLLESQPIGLNSDQMVKTKMKIEVNTITLDDYCREKNIHQIDILKMDIQGGELGALKGATTLLREKKIALIYLEAYFVSQYRDQPLFQDLLTYLFNSGYQLQDIYNPFYGKGSLAWCDAIFLPKK